MKKLLMILALGLSLWGTCVDNMLPSSAIDRFVDNDDGSVSDNKTGLVWQKCNYGMGYGDGVCGGSTEVMTWSVALQTTSDAYGLDDYEWRVPTIKELNSIRERSCSSPAFLGVFDYDGAVAQRYWSSTHANATGNEAGLTEAMIINFKTGTIELQNKSDDTNITLRLVRTRQ